MRKILMLKTVVRVKTYKKRSLFSFWKGNIMGPIKIHNGGN